MNLRVKQLKKAILDYGNSSLGFDWAVLDKIDHLEAELTKLKRKTR